MSALQTLAGIDYRPPQPQHYRPAIGLIGCGGITRHHLQAYRKSGFHVAALCDVRRDAAERRAAEFYPDAIVCEDYRQLLEIDAIEIVDIATHPPERVPIIEDALRAGKHVLSQKPFVLDLDVGQRLVDLAGEKQRYLAVNQNGRWAPHFSFARQAVAMDCLGTICGAHLSCHWDHTWTAGTEFEKIRHLILYDYAIHWFDIVRCFIAGPPERVFATARPAPRQRMLPPLLASALIEFAEGHATLAFDAALPHGGWDRTFLSGSLGSLHAFGPSILDQEVEVRLESGRWRPKLEGCWFPDGFAGTMGELMCAIEQGRPSLIDAADNLHSLALCFAAVHSADTGQAVRPGTIRRLQPGPC